MYTLVSGDLTLSDHHSVVRSYKRKPAFAGLSHTSASLPDKQLQHPNLSMLLTEQKLEVRITQSFVQAPIIFAQPQQAALASCHCLQQKTHLCFLGCVQGGV